MENRNENYWKTFQNINDWIKFSDTKAGIIVTVYGLILTIIYSNAQDVYTWTSSSIFILIITIVAVILTILSVFFAFLCINPSLKNKNPKSLIYFGHIATKNKKYLEYLSDATTVFEDTDKLSTQLSEQIYENSKIAWSKFKNVTYSIRLFFASILCLLIILISYYII